MPPSDEIAALLASKSTPLAGLEFKQALPMIKDSDVNLNRLLRELKGIVDRYTLTRRQGVRPYDMLVVFKRTLAAGSTRLKIYNTEVNTAIKEGRLPFQAQAVYDEIITKLKDTLKESRFQRHTRIENEFNVLEICRLPHSAFLAAWERMLDQIEDAGLASPHEDTLFCRYLNKLAPELLSVILSRA